MEKQAFQTNALKMRVFGVVVKRRRLNLSGAMTTNATQRWKPKGQKVGFEQLSHNQTRY